MLTLIRLSALIVLLCGVLTLSAQDYSNIEFIENRGQWDGRVKYKGDFSSGEVFIRDGGFTILQRNPNDLGTIQEILHNHADNNSTASRKPDGSLLLRSHVYHVDFIGASPKMVVTGDKPLDTYNNYIIGNDPSKWAGNCKIYQAVTLKEVYPNVDVRYYTYNGVMKYDIVARPGADLKKIALRYDGIDKLSIKNKELVVSTSVGDLRESAPYTYQFNGKDRRDVSCKYVVKDNILSFDVKGNDPNATLIIDPALIFCSFSGSRANNWGFTATYGPDGSFFGGGIVFDNGFPNGFPTTTGAFQQSFQGGVSDAPQPIDIGIIKLSPNGSTRVYATYVGGSGNEQPHSLVVDNDGNVVLAGRSNSPNYPLLGNASSIGGQYDIVVTKLNANGSALIGSAKVGGAGNDGVNISINRSGANSLQQNYGDDGRSEVILDGAGNVYVASSSQSTTMGAVTAAGFQPTNRGGQDAVILKFDPSVNNRLFGTFLGGGGNDAAYVLAIAPTGDVYVAGGTESADFPGNKAGTVGATAPGNIDGFVARISQNGASIIQSTFIGTAAIDQVYGIQFDRFGYPYIMGTTTGDMPAINAPYSIPNSKQFIAKLEPDLSAFVYRMTFGTASSRPNISPTAFLVDRCENVYVSGWGGSVSDGFPNAGTAGLPVTADALPYPRGGPDGSDFYFFVLRRNAMGPGPLYASFFGQNGGLSDHVDGGTSRFDRNGVIYQAMCANCGGGGVPPTSPGVWSPGNAALPGGCNLGMAKIAFNLAGVGADVQSAIGGVPRDTAGCVPLDVTFNDIIRNATEYIWDFGDGTAPVGPLPAAAGYTQNHTFNLVGDYRVMMIAIDPNSCNERDTAYVNIRVGDVIANLAADFEKTGSCNSLEFRFDNLSTASRPFTDSSFTWDFGDGSPRVRAGVNSITHTFPAVGPYQVRLVLNDSAYCNNPDSLLLPINVAANVDAQFTTPPQGCAVYDAVFNSSNTIGGQDFTWDFGDPASGADNTSTLANPVHTYTTPGTYTVRMIASNPNTCNLVDTAYATIVVLEGPTPSFTYSPTVPTLNTPYVFANTSSPNSTRFLWYFGDGDSLATASRSNVTHLYNAPGTYTVCLVAYNSLGCSDTVCQDVVSIIEPALDVPNAFTPGRGDVNSIVKPMGFGIAKLKFTIYNRQGKKVFETTSRTQGWDGRVNGVIQPMDVYAYTLAVEFFDGTKTTKTGDITLIR